MTAHRFPPPATWQAFENLCLDLFREMWNAPTIVKHGRGGEAQDGVDLYGLLADGSWFGIQCKEKGDGKRLTRVEMRRELAKAEEFNPRLERYVFATTAPRTKKAQAWVRELTEATAFEVTVFAWDDVCEALAGRHEIIENHFAGILPKPRAVDADPPEDALDTYQQEQWGKLLVLPTLALGAGQADTELLLTDVYTALDVEERIVFGEGAMGRRLPGGDREQEADAEEPAVTLPGDPVYLKTLVRHVARAAADEENRRPPSRRCHALEAAAANQHLVLVGAPGSGKSTFGRFLVLSLLGDALGQAAANLALLNRGGDDAFQPWPHDTPLPFFVELQSFVRSEHFPDRDVQGEAKHLVEQMIGLGPSTGRFDRVVRRALKRPNGVLVVLDGLDETPSASEVRERIRKIISGFVRTHGHARVLVTSRPYAYEADSPWRLDGAGFAKVDLAPFDRAQQAAFVEAWYKRLVRRGQLTVGDERRAALCTDLVDRLRTADYLGPLAERPLLLTMLASVHAASGGSLPRGGRAALYERSIDLLFDRWNETRQGRKPSEMLGMSVPDIRKALELLAFTVHRSRGVDAEHGAEIRSGELWEALSEVRRAGGDERDVDDERIMAYLHQRSGILIGESETVVRFPHRSYQEFMAAGHLLREDFPAFLDQVVTEDPALWREVALFAVGRQADPPIGAWLILERLVPEEPKERVDRDDPCFFRALLAGLAIRENDLWQAPGKPDRPKLERVRRWLRRAVEVGALAAKDRAQAGQILALLGDDRPGIGLGDDGLPRFEWAGIPEGAFTMGGQADFDGKPQHEARVEAFRIARVPVTNAQFQAFADDGGYSERWRHCWTEAGWKEKGDSDGPRSIRHPFDLPNHPRVAVSWYEAVAFSRWLSERTGSAFRLPTEAEWERAARGVDGRAYPWGGEFDATMCNASETDIGATTAVGLFPAGESPAGENQLGILDASGNAWEWCSTKNRPSYDEPADDDLEGAAGRVLRGGSFADGSLYARCAFRDWNYPDFILGHLGFRLVAPFEYL